MCWGIAQRGGGNAVKHNVNACGMALASTAQGDVGTRESQAMIGAGTRYNRPLCGVAWNSATLCTSSYSVLCVRNSGHSEWCSVRGAAHALLAGSTEAARGMGCAVQRGWASAHTVGFAHCSTFASRIQPAAVDPTMDAGYASQLQAACPAGVDPNIALELDPVTPHTFDIQYFVNLQKGMGLFTSDQVLFSDDRSRPTVDA
ncbi:hypothetical protein ABZP36_019766 [Zizania latifolia]